MIFLSVAHVRLARLELFLFVRFDFPPARYLRSVYVLSTFVLNLHYQAVTLIIT